MNPIESRLLVLLQKIGSAHISGEHTFFDDAMRVIALYRQDALDFAFIGRWVGHLPRGRFFHDAIAKAQPVPGEAALGWITHYAIGIAFAALLVILAGSQWPENPTALPAVLVGLGTVAAPLLVMQPAMGAGVLARKTATPLRNCLRSLVNHGVFGFGLFLAAALYQHIGG